jgi:phosphatidylglycerophosphatase A
VLTILALTFLACYVAGEAEKIFDRKDAPAIVIDEIVGFLWTMLFITPTLPHLIGGFVLFRFFDITKIFPARFCETHFEGGYGVVMDDIVAGVYANVALQMGILIWKV